MTVFEVTHHVEGLWGLFRVGSEGFRLQAVQWTPNRMREELPGGVQKKATETEINREKGICLFIAQSFAIKDNFPFAQPSI